MLIEFKDDDFDTKVKGEDIPFYNTQLPGVLRVGP